ncbi:hypothetical protein [Parasitella parasitica]|uniref:Uncharacterized protein n=1 Tax=Parasitella parasitica TaxID=35722 RepID=A0A0B7N4J6_9FUNG|nr:hypothetical protein [Parasitella parasitica]
MPRSACVGLLGALDFNVVTFVMALLIFCSPKSTGLALYSLVVLLFGLVVGVGLWVLWPRRHAMLSLFQLVCGATAASPCLTSSRLVFPALPPAVVAVEPAVSAPATTDVSGVLPAASVDLFPAPACSVVSPAPSPTMAVAAKPALMIESVAPAVLSLPAASGADVGLVLCGVGGPACVVPPGDKILISVSPRVKKVVKKRWSCKSRRQITRTNLSSLGVEVPPTPMSIDESNESIAADVPLLPAAMEDVIFSSRGIWFPASAAAATPAPSLSADARPVGFAGPDSRPPAAASTNKEAAIANRPIAIPRRCRRP